MPVSGWIEAADMMWTRLRDHRIADRVAVVDNLQFPASGRQLVGNQHAHLTGDDIRVVEAATRQWFRLVARRPRATLTMPSVVADDLWQDLTLHLRDYAAFCDAAFGRLLQHQRRPAIASTSRVTALLATLNYARRDEGCSSTDLPLLFRVDKILGIRDGSSYLADCGGRGECFEAPGRICLQHLAGPGKRLARGGIRGDLPFNDGRHGGGFGGGGGGDFGSGAGDDGGGGGD
jgi:uncharacterized membrane protein YgcG